MENLLFFIASSFVLRIASPRKSVNQLIGNTGCSVLFQSGKEFEKAITDSGDDLYFNEFTKKGACYGIICIDMKKQYSMEHAREMLAAYMHKLKGPFYVFHNTGHEVGSDWNHEGSVTLVDYWQDAVGVDCKVKGYTNGRILSVLYVKNITEVPVSEQDQFLDSFHFGS